MVSPLGVVFLFGFLSLCGDIVYEGGRSVMGPYLALLGAGAFSVGLVSGAGEFFGYGLRIVFGYWADRKRAYWPLTVLGYSLILAIPLMAFCRSWQAAAGLILLERLGKAIRSPGRDVLLAQAARSVGTGFGFGLHEALDQIGAIVGPLCFSLLLVRGYSYRDGFNLLWLPGSLLLVVLLVLGRVLPTIPRSEKTVVAEPLSGKFVLYLLFVFLCLSGCVSFPLIAYHVQKQAVFPAGQIPLLYVMAMAVDGVAALMTGPAYDRVGLTVLLSMPVLIVFIPLLSFTTSPFLVICGVALWGGIIGMQETVMRASITALAGMSRRGIAYGLLNTAGGAGALVAGLLAGFLYARARLWLAPVLIVVEMMALLVAVALVKQRKTGALEKKIG